MSNFQIVQQQNFSLFNLCNSNHYCKNLNFHIFNLWSSIFQPVLQHHLSAVIIRPFQVDGNQAKKLKKNSLNQNLIWIEFFCDKFTKGIGLISEITFLHFRQFGGKKSSITKASVLNSCNILLRAVTKWGFLTLIVLNWPTLSSKEKGK